MNTNHIINELKEQLSQIQGTRANPSLVENIEVEYYGDKLTIKELASISVPDAHTILIQAWDKECLSNIENALQAKSLNSQNNGQAIRVSVPALTEEKKEQLNKQVREKAEQARIRIRQMRDKEREQIKKITDKDEQFRKLEDLDKETEKINKEIDTIKENKIAQINS